MIENVQKRFTKRLFSNSALAYNERLVALNLESLEERRVKSDVIECFKRIRKLTSRGNNFFENSKNKYNEDKISL